jgi:hypothetical protein
MTAQQRGARALKALKTYPAYDRYDLRSSIVDLIADLFHLITQKGGQKKYQEQGNMTIESIVNIAQQHHHVERTHRP